MSSCPKIGPTNGKLKVALVKHIILSLLLCVVGRKPVRHILLDCSRIPTCALSTRSA